MKKRLPLILCFGALALVITITACVSLCLSKTTKDAYELVPPLENLSLAVAAELQNPFRTNQVTGDSLIVAVYDKKPWLKEKLAPYRLMITNNSKCAIILLMPKDKNSVWLEDGTWSQNVDKFHFLSNTQPSAAFTLAFP